MKGLITILFFFWMVSYSCCRVLQAPESWFNVMDYGADGTGRTDSSQAFYKAWKDFCQSNEENPTLEVPKGKIFLLKTVTFTGPCHSKNPHLLIRGTIIAPNNFNSWPDVNRYETWIGFMYISGLIIDGGGRFDGQGAVWWRACKVNSEVCLKRPQALHFHSCNGLQLRNMKHLNSQGGHIGINGCDNVDLSNLQILAPEDSPNTDGIDISASNHVTIYNSTIGTGDDCVAINGFSSYINITQVTCGPGHGISVGSLGKNGAHETVEEVHVRNCTFKGTQNGARIKTWKGGSGYVRKVSFDEIILENTQNPIIINQEYVDSIISGGSADISISDVTYRDVHGSSATDAAITLNCASEMGCSNIVMDYIKITSSTPGKQTFAACNNAQGTFKFVYPKVSCQSG